MIGWRGYLSYLQYILRHKWHVARHCFRLGIYHRGLTHDLSKLLPDEFIAYARYWIGYGGAVIKDPNTPVPAEVKQAFQEAVARHRRRNRHHWQHWVSGEDSGRPVARPVDDDTLKEMICDWDAIKDVFPEAPGSRRFYIRERDNIIMDTRSRERLENFLRDLGAYE